MPEEYKVELYVHDNVFRDLRNLGLYENARTYSGLVTRIEDNVKFVPKIQDVTPPPLKKSFVVFRLL